MPQPIRPVSELEKDYLLFSSCEGESAPEEFVSQVNKKVAISMNVIQALEEIDKNTDLISSAVAQGNERYCSIPKSINNETILKLKIDGYITGYGSTVQITDKGRIALKNNYLSKQNSIKEKRGAEKFDYKKYLNDFLSNRSKDNG